MDDISSLIIKTTDSISIVLFKYNLIDLRLWTGLINKVPLLEYSENSITLKSDLLKKYISENFTDNINLIESFDIDNKFKIVNIIYYLNLIINQIENLNIVKFTIDRNKNYSRLILDESGIQLLKFSFKTLKINFKFIDFFNKNEIKTLNSILSESLFKNKPFVIIKLNDLFKILDDWLIEFDILDDELEDFNYDEDGLNCITILLDLLSYNEIVSDNPEILIITDY